LLLVELLLLLVELLLLLVELLLLSLQASLAFTPLAFLWTGFRRLDWCAHFKSKTTLYAIVV